MGEEQPVLKICVFYDFLYSHKAEFERILFVDVSDVMFQADPFTSDIHPDELYFVGLAENRSVTGKKGQMTDQVFGGGVEPSLVFLDICLTYYLYMSEETDHLPYATHFLQIHSNLLTSSKRIRAELFAQEQQFVDLLHHTPPAESQRPGYVRTTHGFFARIIGHFSAKPTFTYNYYDSCPRGKITLAKYKRSIPEVYMNGTVDRHGNSIIASIGDDDD
jgi:hypothetical protein